MKVPAIILAAGASRRLGRPKQLVRVNGETLLARTIRVAIEAGATSTVVVLGAGYDQIAATLNSDQTHVVFNSNWVEGMSTSICAGLEALLTIHPGTEYALLLVCDQPRLRVSHLNLLMESLDSNDTSFVIASGYGGFCGIPAIFPSRYFSDLLMLSGDQGARSLVRHLAPNLVIIPMEDGAIDIDTPGDVDTYADD